MNNDFSLDQLQQWMQGMLMQGDAALAGAHDGLQVNDVVHASSRLSAAHHLELYRHSYIARLRACMQQQFRALAYALGNELFEAFADQYLDACPSDSYTLNTLGDRFPAFLEATRPDAAAAERELWPDFVVELAAFENALSGIFDEDAAECRTMARHDTPDALLRTVPVFHLFRHRFPICRYYLGFIQDQKPELPFPEESFCIVTRRNYKLGLFPVRAAQYYFLKSMRQGRTVAEAREDLIKTRNADSGEVDAVWKAWRDSFITSGFFCI